MKLKFLGTGTSQGVPMIGCKDPVCLSNDLKDKRLRTSALITTDNGKKILIDCGPDFRQQMLDNQEDMVDAVLITHEHNDHIIGLDDLRPLIFMKKQRMPLYCTAHVADEIKLRFPYAFAEVWYPGAPTFDLMIIQENINIFENFIIPIHVLHGKLSILGFKIKNLAYITDANEIPETENEKLQNLDVLILNCLRKTKPHHSHFILPQALEIIDKFRPKKAYFVHMNYEIGFHEKTEAELPENVHLAFDGLEIGF